MPTVSIIIPCYNTGRYLRQAIESCLNQTHQDLEIIVVDDGSTDDTRAIATSIPQVKYIYQANAGLAAARNTGIAAATGAYIQFLDADDILLPEKIGRCLAVFAESPDVDVVYTDYERRSDDFGQVVPKPDLPPVQGRNVAKQLITTTSSHFPVHAALIKADTVRRTGGFKPDCQGVEDWLFWATIAAQGGAFHYIGEVLVWYRYTPNSMSQQAVKMSRSRLNACLHLRDVPLPADVNLDALIAGRYHDYAMKLWHDGQPQEARIQFRAALEYPDGKTARRLLYGLTYVATARQAERLLAAVGRG